MKTKIDPTRAEKVQQRLAELRRFLLRGGSMSMLHGVDSEQLDALYGSAYACLEQKDFQAARNLFALLAQADHWNIEYWLGLGISQQRLGEHGPALAAFAFMESLAVQDPRSRFYAALSYQVMGDPQKAANAMAACLLWCGSDPAYQMIREQAQKYSLQTKN